MQNPHRDILNADIPEEGPKRQQLLDELKSRAKGAFQCKDLMNAEALYGRAIECNDSDHLLYSNRAAVRLLFAKNDGALRDTDRCLKLEPTFIKAHYRKAQALHRLKKFKDGIDACKIALDIHADNAEIKSLQSEIQQDWEKDMEEKKKFNADANDLTKERPKPQKTIVSLTNDKPKAKPKDEGSDEAKLRGYKQTADGKTTSYFHTDISDEARQLIKDAGFGAPKKIETPAVDTAGKSGMGSAWNTAGTFESKDKTKWFKERIRASIHSDTIVTLPNNLPCIELSLDSVYGDASIACTRGKVKYLHDMSVDVKWKFETDDGKKAEGTAKFENDGDGDFDVVIEVDNKTHSQVRSIVNEYVKSSAKGMQPFVVDSIRKIEKEFQAIGAGA